MEDNAVEEILFGKSVFKNEATLLSEYVPPRLPRRQSEVMRLAQDFRPLLIRDGSFAVNIAIVGDAGIGKSALAKSVMEKIVQAAAKRNVKILYEYFNCYTFRTKSAILRNLLTERFHILSRGFSDEELLSMLVKRLVSENAKLIIVLDEAPILGGGEILSMLHASEVYGFGQSRISTVIVSRPSEWRVVLSAPLSGHIHDQINMRSYSKEDLLEILRYRTDIAFVPGAIPEDILDMVAEIASQTRNARHGIEILYQSGKEADSEGKSQLTADMIRQAKESVYPELRYDVFYTLKPQEILVALSIARVLSSKGSTSTTIDEAFSSYRVICEEENFPPQFKASFRKNVNLLLSLGFMGLIVGPIEKGKRGRHGRITLYDIPASVLEERLHDILRRLKKGELSDSG
ncbi:MAG: AAA family ATPase [Promethearchaeati archaeon SRVP18_Atabeyarchaeia-1]